MNSSSLLDDWRFVVVVVVVIVVAAVIDVLLFSLVISKSVWVEKGNRGENFTERGLLCCDAIWNEFRTSTTFINNVSRSNCLL